MSASAIDATRRLVSRHKEGLIDNAALVISSLAVMIAAFGLLFGGIAMYIAYDDLAKWERSYKELEREYRLAVLEIDDMRLALAKAGIDLSHEEKP